MELQDAGKEEFSYIGRLYKSAFPRDERAPFFMIKRKALQGKARALVAKENGIVLGFAYVICYEDLVYLFYFAVDAGRRGSGNGSRILQLLKEKYAGKRIFLAREQLDEKAGNYEERLKRHAFYLKNGFQDLPHKIREASVVYDIMGVGGVVSPEEYAALIENWCGRFIRRVVRLEIIV